MPSKSKATGFRNILSASGQAKKAADIPAPPPPAGGRRVKPGYIQVGANIPKQLKREVFKALQDEDGLNFSSLVERLLADWLKEKR